jgi:DNA replication protein DnaC
VTPQGRAEQDRQIDLRLAALNAKAREDQERDEEERRKKIEESQVWLQTTAGQAWSAEQAVLRAEARVREEAANWKSDYLLIGVISRLAPAALEGDGIEAGQALEHARDYVWGGGLKRGESLTLLGGSGGGKSFAAAAVLRAAARSGSRKFIYFPSLIGALLDRDQRKAALAEAKETRLVVFDEIGGGYVKQGGLIAPLFEEIIFWRHGESRPTIFTSNLTEEEFKANLSDRVIDRIKEWGPVFRVTDPSFRQRYRAEAGARKENG